MRKIIRYAMLATMLIALNCLALAGVDQCYTCHQTLGSKPALLFHKDIHYTKGITCANCHGGDPTKEEMEQAMDSTKGFKGVPKGDDISKLCASCHANPEKMKSYGSTLPTNQWENLQASVHGKLAISGKEHIVQCITCHSVHEIVSVKNPASPVYPLNVVKTCTKCHADAAYMKEYNPALPVDQLDKYRTSVHGMLNEKGDPKVAACANCHGSHDIRSAKDLKSRVYAVNVPGTCSTCHSNAEYMKEYNIPTDQFDKYSKSAHGIALLVKKDVSAPACNDCHGNHGATPPGVESISKVCGTCHAINADLFSSSPHKKAFDDQNLPECETCHSNHEILPVTVNMLGTAPEAVCSKCHTESLNPKGFMVAKTMRSLMDTLLADEQTASKLLDQAEQKGMEVSEARFKLRDAHQATLQARTAVHSFNEQKFRDVVSKGIIVAAGVVIDGQAAVDEYYFRRWGLGIASLIITIVGISLYVAIRRIERKQNLKKTNQNHNV